LKNCTGETPVPPFFLSSFTDPGEPSLVTETHPQLFLVIILLRNA
jgi:hypothetical protein